ncbi:MAG: hypothetical protein IJO48_05445 [Clostridia bacterium]|nr:hypothetical protein [Clostridia bacterium]
MSKKINKINKKRAQANKERIIKKSKRNIVISLIAAVVIIAVIVILIVSGEKKPKEIDYNNMTEKDWQNIVESFGTAKPYTVATPTGDVVSVEVTPSFLGIETLDEKEMKPTVVSGLTFPYAVPDTGMTVLMLNKYSGPYIEDSSNDYVGNCCAMLVKNTGDTTIAYAELSFIVNEDENEEAIFKISMLGAGECAIVLEANKREYKENDIYMVNRKGVSRIDDVSFNSEKVQTAGGEKEITITNLTDKEYSKVVVYFKNLYMEDLYFGGITYTRTFENVKANETMTLASANYLPDVCRIVRVDVSE